MNKDNVTAEDLVRAIKEHQTSPFMLADSMGWVRHPKSNFDEAYYTAINYIANLITLPEQQPQTVKLTTGATVSYEQYKVVADYQNEQLWDKLNDFLPFSESINGVEQNG